eukprot:2661374-Rhodomonas_salina.2
MWTLTSSPTECSAVDAMRLAVFTVSPKMLKRGDASPTTPAHSPPRCTPTLKCGMPPSGSRTRPARFTAACANSRQISPGLRKDSFEELALATSAVHTAMKKLENVCVADAASVSVETWVAGKTSLCTLPPSS